MYLNKVKNQTFYEYVNNYRLDYAAKMLEEGASSGTIQEVAAASGFVSASTFRRLFQKKFGMSPKEYRKLSS